MLNKHEFVFFSAARFQGCNVDDEKGPPSYEAAQMMLNCPAGNFFSYVNYVLAFPQKNPLQYATPLYFKKKITFSN